MLLQCLASSFGSIPPTVWEMSFELFQDGCHGGHLGYLNRMNLAILNLYNSPKPPIKFQLNLTYCLRLDVVEEFQAGHRQSNLQFRRRCHLKTFKISEWNNFSNSESLCCSAASYNISAQSDLWFGRRCHLKNFKMATLAASGHPGYQNGKILAILNLCVTVMPPIKLWLNPT